MGPACGVTIAARAADTLAKFPEARIHVLFMLKNGETLQPATPKDATKFNVDAGWGDRGTTLVDADMKGRSTYFGEGEVGTMLLSKGFVIRAINAHDFAKELPAVLEAESNQRAELLQDDLGFSR